jgi:hypothetical protein
MIASRRAQFSMPSKARAALMLKAAPAVALNL